MNCLITFLLCILASSALAVHKSIPLRLITACDKKEIFVGEQTVCSFTIASRFDFIEIEVAKFPEFRGFWSENLTLRQGPIALMEVDPRSHLKLGPVGSYALIPMLGDTLPLIMPMKLVTRPIGKGGTPEEIRIESEAPALRIKPLPPFPTGTPPFIDGVGELGISVESSEVPFLSGEPVQIRYRVQGDGNFPEIHQLPIPWGDSIEIITKKTTLGGTGPYMTKIFDYTLVVRSETDVRIPDFRVSYFRPASERYETIHAPSMFLKYQPPSPLLKDIPVSPFQLPETISDWSAHRPISKHPLFLGIHLGFLISFLVGIVFLLRNFFVQSREKDTRLQFQLKTQIVWQTLANGNVENFLRLAGGLGMEILMSRIPSSSSLTKSQIFALAEQTTDKDFLHHLNLLTNTYDYLAYSADKYLIHDPESLKTSFAYITQFTGRP